MDLTKNPGFRPLEPEFAVPIGLLGSGEPFSEWWRHIDAGQAICEDLFGDKDPNEAVGDAKSELDKALAAAVAKATDEIGVAGSSSASVQSPEPNQDANEQDDLNDKCMLTRKPTEADLDALASHKEEAKAAAPPPLPSPPPSPEAAAAIDVLYEETVEVVDASADLLGDVTVLAENDPKLSDQATSKQPLFIIIQPTNPKAGAASQIQVVPAAAEQIQVLPAATEQIRAVSASTNQVKIGPAAENKIQVVPAVDNKVQEVPAAAEQFQVVPLAIKEEDVEPPVMSIPYPHFIDDKTQGAQFVTKYKRSGAVEFSQTEILTESIVPLYLGKQCDTVSLTVAYKNPPPPSPDEPEKDHILTACGSQHKYNHPKSKRHDPGAH